MPCSRKSVLLTLFLIVFSLVTLTYLPQTSAEKTENINKWEPKAKTVFESEPTPFFFEKGPLENYDERTEDIEVVPHESGIFDTLDYVEIYKDNELMDNIPRWMVQPDGLTATDYSENYVKFRKPDNSVYIFDVENVEHAQPTDATDNIQVSVTLGLSDLGENIIKAVKNLDLSYFTDEYYVNREKVEDLSLSLLDNISEDFDSIPIRAKRGSVDKNNIKLNMDENNPTVSFDMNVELEKINPHHYRGSGLFGSYSTSWTVSNKSGWHDYRESENIFENNDSIYLRESTTFESGSLGSEWNGTTSDYDVNTNYVYYGDYSLTRLYNDDTYSQVYRPSGFSADNENISFIVHLEESESNASVMFGHQDSNNYYAVELLPSGNDWDLIKVEDGSESTLQNGDFSYGTPVDIMVRINWKSDGTIYADILDPSADPPALLTGLEATDTTFLSGGIGFRTYKTSSSLDARAITNGYWKSTKWDSGSTDTQVFENVDYSAKIDAGEDIYWNVNSYDNEGNFLENSGWTRDEDGLLTAEDLSEVPEGTQFSLDIRLEPTSSTHSPSINDYTLYVEDKNKSPDEPSNPDPSNGEEIADTDSTIISVDVSDPDEDPMDVFFYDNSDDSLIDTDLDVSSGGTASVEWSGLENGKEYSWYTVADDGVENTKSSTWSFYINDPPKATFNYSPKEPAVDEEVSFNAENSEDTDGSISSYEWDVDDDGSYEQAGENITHSFSNKGAYTVTLRVTDNTGDSTTHSETVDVQNNPPNAPFEPSPENDSSIANTSETDLSVTVTDPDSDEMDVQFIRIGENENITVDWVINVENGDRVSVPMSVVGGSNYEWKAIAYDGVENTESNTWNFYVEESETSGGGGGGGAAPPGEEEEEGEATNFLFLSVIGPLQVWMILVPIGLAAWWRDYPMVAGTVAIVMLMGVALIIGWI